MNAPVRRSLADCVSKLSVAVQTDGTYKGRLSLREGEGEGEGLSWFNCVCSFQTPHLNPLPLLKGRGDRDHSTNATFR